MIYHGIFFLMPAHPVATRRIAPGQSVGGGSRLEDVNIATTGSVQSAAAAGSRSCATGMARLVGSMPSTEKDTCDLPQWKKRRDVAGAESVQYN